MLATQPSTLTKKTATMDDGTFSASATTTTTSFGPLFLVTGSPWSCRQPRPAFVLFPSSLLQSSFLCWLTADALPLRNFGLVSEAAVHFAKNECFSSLTGAQQIVRGNTGAPLLNFLASNVMSLHPFHAVHCIPLGSDTPFALKNRPDVSLYPPPLHQPGKHKI